MRQAHVRILGHIYCSPFEYAPQPDRMASVVTTFLHKITPIGIPCFKTTLLHGTSAAVQTTEILTLWEPWWRGSCLWEATQRCIAFWCKCPIGTTTRPEAISPKNLWQILRDTNFSLWKRAKQSLSACNLSPVSLTLAWVESINRSIKEILWQGRKTLFF